MGRHADQGLQQAEAVAHRFQVRVGLPLQHGGIDNLPRLQAEFSCFVAGVLLKKQGDGGRQDKRDMGKGMGDGGYGIEDRGQKTGDK